MAGETSQLRLINGEFYFWLISAFCARYTLFLVDRRASSSRESALGGAPPLELLDPLALPTRTRPQADHSVCRPATCGGRTQAKLPGPLTPSQPLGTHGHHRPSPERGGERGRVRDCAALTGEGLRGGAFRTCYRMRLRYFVAVLIRFSLGLCL